MTTSLLLTLIRFGVAGVVGFAGFAKLADPASSRAAVRAAGVPPALQGAAARLLPLVELATAVALALSGGPAATTAAFGLVTVLNVGLGIAVLRGTAGTCGCFGQARSRLGWQAVVRNGGLAAACVALQLASH